MAVGDGQKAMLGKIHLTLRWWCTLVGVIVPTLITPLSVL